jgi:RNA polymerase sigma-70 factor (ECF subfamily)
VRQGATDQFEANRDHLYGVAYRMLGSSSEAEDAVQEAWLRLQRVDVHEVDNMQAWLTTVVSRIALDALRARNRRREEIAATDATDVPEQQPAGDPEAEAVMADSVGRALLVVLDRLGPAERVAFVLHDMFSVPFDDIAPIVDRTPATTKKLASRARSRVRGPSDVDHVALDQHRHVIEAFLAAARAGDIDALLRALAPDVVRRADAVALAPGRPTEVRGAETVAGEIAIFGANAQYASPVLIDGSVGLVIAPAGQLRLAMTFVVRDNQIVEYTLVADPARLAKLDIALVPARPATVQGT